MNIKDLVFKDTIAKGYSFIRQCLLKDQWQKGADEYNNAVKQLADSCTTTEEFVKQYLTHSEWKKEQCYQAMLKQYEPENVWYYVREMFGIHSKKTESDAGALKLGTNAFTINIPNDCGEAVEEELTGKYQIYFYDGFVALVRVNL